VSLKSWQKDTFVAIALNKGMNGISVSFYCGEDYRSIFIREFFGWVNRGSSIGNSMLVDSLCILNLESYIFDSISMLLQMFIKLLRAVGSIDRTENKDGVDVFNDVVGNGSLSCFQSLVGIVLEAELGGIIGSSLLSVANPEGYMVYR
jgi:hypothetical protein